MIYEFGNVSSLKGVQDLSVDELSKVVTISGSVTTVSFFPVDYLICKRRNTHCWAPLSNLWIFPWRRKWGNPTYFSSVFDDDPFILNSTSREYSHLVYLGFPGINGIRVSHSPKHAQSLYPWMKSGAFPEVNMETRLWKWLDHKAGSLIRNYQSLCPVRILFPVAVERDFLFRPDLIRTGWAFNSFWIRASISSMSTANLVHIEDELGAMLIPDGSLKANSKKIIQISTTKESRTVVERKEKWRPRSPFVPERILSAPARQPSTFSTLLFTNMTTSHCLPTSYPHFLNILTNNFNHILISMTPNGACLSPE